MPTIEKSIEVNAPVRESYNQWTKLEEFHRSMEGVQEVHQLDGKRLHGKAEIGGREKESELEIVEQTPDLCIAWTSRSGAISGGLVTFQPLSETRSKVRVYAAYDPEDITKDAGNAVRAVSLSVQSILERFLLSTHPPSLPGSPSAPLSTQHPELSTSSPPVMGCFPAWKGVFCGLKNDLKSSPAPGLSGSI